MAVLPYTRGTNAVLSAVPAAGYIKSQAYVPLTQSQYVYLSTDRSIIFTRWQSARRFIDPALNSILESTLTPDDNDLFSSNVIGSSILVVHGQVHSVTPGFF